MTGLRAVWISKISGVSDSSRVPLGPTSTWRSGGVSRIASNVVAFLLRYSGRWSSAGMLTFAVATYCSDPEAPESRPMSTEYTVLAPDTAEAESQACGS